jgi:predicted NAD/FAD-dependent oxidoreductase
VTATLYPTKARVELLVDVGAGRVYRNGWHDYRAASPRPQRVTARISELRQAGWVERGPDGVYALTTAGEDIVAESQKEEIR